MNLEKFQIKMKFYSLKIFLIFFGQKKISTNSKMIQFYFYNKKILNKKKKFKKGLLNKYYQLILKSQKLKNIIKD